MSMFNQFKSMGAIAGVLKNKEKIKAAADELKERIAVTHAEGEAGSGAVRVVASADMKIVSVSLSPGAGGAMDEASRAMLENLITEATNEALLRARALLQGEVVRLTQELGLHDLPGLENLLPEE